MYLKTIERLGLYISTHFKNGSDMKKCLKLGKIVKLVVPDHPDEHTAHKKRVWEYHMSGMLKAERVLKTNLCNLFAILMSLCDSETKNQAESSTEHEELEISLDYMGLLAVINKLIFTRGTNNQHICHNKAITQLMTLYQEKFQDTQDFRNQDMAIRKVCNELRLRFGRCEDDVRAMLKKTGINAPTTAQLKKALDKIEEEHLF